MTDVAALREDCASRRNNEIDLESDELSGDFGEALVASLRQRYSIATVRPLDPTEIAQALAKAATHLVP